MTAVTAQTTESNANLISEQIGQPVARNKISSSASSLPRFGSLTAETSNAKDSSQLLFGQVEAAGHDKVEINNNITKGPRKLRPASSERRPPTKASNKTNKANKGPDVSGDNSRESILSGSVRVVGSPSGDDSSRGNKGSEPAGPDVEADAAGEPLGWEQVGGNNKLKQQRQQRRRAEAKRGQKYFIDSRSILTNKERLKKFWERRMELDLELRRKQRQPAAAMAANGLAGGGQQQQRHRTAADLPSKARPLGGGDPLLISEDANHAPVQLAAKMFDENNNNNSSENEDFEPMREIVAVESRTDGKGDDALEGARHSDGPLQVKATKTTTVTSNGVSVGVKKRDQQDNYVVKTSLTVEEKSANLNGKPTEFDGAKNGNLLPVDEPNVSACGRGSPGVGPPTTMTTTIVARELPRGASEAKVASADGKPAAHNQSPAIETQLMSIDPTLCRASERDERQSKPIINQGSEASDASAAGQEEQTCNEEFSSSSSSFGPMSISIPCDPSGTQEDRNEPALVGQQQKNQQDQDQLTTPTAAKLTTPNSDYDDEDEPNSTQSGSVLTVINRLSDDDTDATVLAQTVGDSAGKGIAEEEDDTGSDIGVAFESLQFDDEIKSSKHEQVNEDRLLAAPNVASRHRAQAGGESNTKFSSSEVRSVCSFIASAITDATRQVEKFIKRDEPIASESDAGRDNEGIQRATFVSDSSAVDNANRRASPDHAESQHRAQHQETQFTEDYDEEDETASDEIGGDSGDYPDEAAKADLSSMFEANVRREIERFESNSVLRRVSDTCNRLTNGKKTNDNSTERKIAEEIRLFNEREQELKMRLDGQHNGHRIKPLGPNNKLQNHECVVRFGKTLQIPKPSASSAGLLFTNNSHQFVSQELHQSGMAAATAAPHLAPSRSIKLSATSNGTGKHANLSGGATTTISMHKFISSGGKRFVYTTSSGSPASSAASTASSRSSSSSSSPSSSSSSTAVAAAAAPASSGFASVGNNLRKSNISTSLQTLASQPDVGAQKAADYKAVDSLSNKETPNVEPGLTKKAIETFSRLSNDLLANGNHHQLALSATQLPNGTAQQQQQQQSQTTFASHRHSAHMSSAEWKIQEELRDMRAREAELKSLRSQRGAHVKVGGNGGGGKSALCSSEPPIKESARAGHSKLSNADRDHGEHIKAVQRFQSNQPLPYSQADKLSFSSDSLYPIKQTIDTFKKLNSSLAQNGGKLAQQRKQQRRGEDQVNDVSLRKQV